jgi:hypothetical protein
MECAMLKTKRILVPLLVSTLGVVLEMVLFSYWPTGGPAAAEEPLALTEVARLAEKLGLHWCSDREDGLLDMRLVLSLRPVSWENANDLRCVDPGHPCWIGTVSIARPTPYCTVVSDAEQYVLWRGLRLYGDVQVIRKLTGYKL